MFNTSFDQTFSAACWCVHAALPVLLIPWQSTHL
jgi:hypothetical protein